MNRKPIFFSVFLSLLLFAGRVRAQEPGYMYRDAAAFPVYGRVAESVSGRYERLPADYAQRTRGAVWDISHHAAGIAVRFRSDSPSIRLRWVSAGLMSMSHMTDTGSRGLDLYIREPGDVHWRFAGSAMPRRDTLNDREVIAHMTPMMREYLVYLSLYEGVKRLEIGVEEGCVVEAPVLDSPRKGSPVVMYGTSILQGGCASRPGMAFTNILSRELDREVVNLGFSGNGRLDLEIAEWMAQAENPALYVLDALPNCHSEWVEERLEPFFRILRRAHPDVPVVFVEHAPYPAAAFDRQRADDIAARNAAQRAVYERLRKNGEKRIFYIKGEKLLGQDGEDTVEGIHFTDLGMVRYAEAVLPTLKKALKSSR